MKSLHPLWLPVLAPFFLLSSAVYGRDFGANLSVASESTDNALKTAENPISERQDQVEVGLFALHQAEFWKLDANYSAAYHEFSENSQDARSTLEGDGKLSLGQDTQIANLLLTHSRRSVLGAPQQIDLLQNADERSITTVTPLLRARLSPVDFLVVSADYSEVVFKYNALRDSTRTTGRLLWQHVLSPVDGIQVSAQQTTIEFGDLPLADYTLQQATVKYAVQLKRLSYSVGGGYSSSESDARGKFSSPNFAVDAAYKSGPQTFALTLTQEISDTSLGNSNRGEVSEPLALDAIGIGFDQIKLQTASFTWSTQLPSERWGLNISLQRDTEDYFTLPEDATQVGARIGFDYILSRSSTLSSSVQKQKTTSEPGSIQGSFDARIWNLGYRHSFVNEIDAAIFARQETRSAAQNLSVYDERIVGASVSYSY